MSRAFSKTDLLQAIRVISQILKAFPDAEYTADGEPETTPPRAPRRPLASDAGVVTAANAPRDGSYASVDYGYGKGQLQPPRKVYATAPKVKIDRVVWDGVPRAGQRIVRYLATQEQPQTSHTIMQTLEIGRSTFDNAMSVLTKRKIVIAISARGGRRREIAEQR